MTDAQLAWKEAIEEKLTENPRMSRAAAVIAVAREQPELRKRVVDEANQR